jgi:hypothetical protein
MELITEESPYDLSYPAWVKDAGERKVTVHEFARMHESAAARRLFVYSCEFVDG